ncbi:uncharacterized protein LOC119408655 [Nematolebias whitei]|uniref:uncharacterized protein LOC119408655 n=1 Tax=Nematolebias whitei TaxID=451745 RepID=UPI001899AA70|nr:uncharacterized protein LOC119408655 [Nematolebias whitei]
MTLLWVTLFLLHQGYALVPVVTVQLGDPVTLTCAVADKFHSVTWLHWYKQSAGETLKLIMIQQQNIKPTFEPEFPTSRFSATSDEKTSKLTILRTLQQDEGLYHCAHMDWTQSTWSGSYLSIKGNTERTSNYTVVSAHPADSETLQCSVLSDSEDETCSGGLSVFWFRARSENSYPHMIYTDGYRPPNCDKTSDTQRRCSFNFTKKMSSSDAGTYYCAVATCGQIFIGQGTKLDSDKPSSHKYWLHVITVIGLVISVIINIVFICHRIQKSICKQYEESSSSHARQNNLSQPEDTVTSHCLSLVCGFCFPQSSCSVPPRCPVQLFDTEEEQDLSYTALHFSEGKSPRGTKKRSLKTEESVYSQVKSSV